MHIDSPPIALGHHSAESLIAASKAGHKERSDHFANNQTAKWGSNSPFFTYELVPAYEAVFSYLNSSQLYQHESPSIMPDPLQCTWQFPEVGWYDHLHCTARNSAFLFILQHKLLITNTSQLVLLKNTAESFSPVLQYPFRISNILTKNENNLHDEDLIEVSK